MEFRILGPLEVLEGNRPVPVGGARQRALLAILVTRANEVVSTDRLVEELWGEAPPEGAANALQAAISRLRRALEAGRGEEAPGPRVLTQPPGYLLEVDPKRIDAGLFERLVAEGSRALTAGDPGRASAVLGEALGLWRGSALGEFTYEPFAQPEIARLDELRLTATEDRIEAELCLGRHAEVVGELEALVTRHPFRERMRVQLILSLYRSGRQAESLDVYREGRETMAEELGVDPSQELRDLEAAILRQDPALLLPVEPAASSRAAAVALQPAAARMLTEPSPEVSRVEEVRRTVTVVFADVAESTPLGERLDPEALREVIARYFEAAREAIHRHGGTVEKFIGDAVMAVFGIPLLHEDDAIRALRAASDLRANLAELNEELERGWGQRLEVRIGVNTGEVVAGEDPPGQALVTGDPVNTAARLQQAAEPGEILIGELTYRLVAAAVEAEPLQRLALKGKRDPVSAWRVSRVIPEAPPFPRHLDAPLVGRAAELAQLRQAFDRAVRERTACLFTVLGAPGIGKTRLALEFTSAVEPEAAVVTGRCLPYGEGITYWPLREIMRQAFGEDVRGEIEELLQGEEHSALIAERVAGAIGLSETQGTVEEIRWAVRKVLEALARQLPLLLVVEDLHWAEPTLLDLVEHVAELTTDSSILLLCLARPDLLEDRPSWGGGKVNASSVLLDALPPEEAQALVANLAPGTRLTTPDLGRVMGAAEGNPLFLEQMVTMMEEGGSGDQEVPIPPTIQALLAARLEHLGPGERAVLQRAAVVGKEFSDEAVADLLPEEARYRLRRHLDELIRRRFIRQSTPSAPGGASYRFRHVLIQQATYRAIAKRLRAELHQRFAGWIERTSGERIVEVEEILGYHLEQAYWYRSELGRLDEDIDALGSHAAEVLASAGRRARARADMSAVANLMSRAAALLPAEHPLRRDLLPALADAFLQTGDLRRSGDVLEEAMRIAERTGDRKLECRTVLARQSLRSSLSLSQRESLAEAERVIPILEELGDHAGLARAWLYVGESHFWLGRSELARAACERAADYARLAGDRRGELDAVGRLAWAYASSSVPGPEYAAELHSLRERTDGDPRVTARIDLQLAWFTAGQGRFRDARELCRGASETLEGLGLWMDAADQHLGRIELLAGNVSEAERVLRGGLERLQAVGERGNASTTAGLLAEALWRQGQVVEAERVASLANELGHEDDFYTQILWRGVLARIRAHHGRLDEGESLAREALEIIRQTDWAEEQADILVVLGEILQAAGRNEEALPLVREAIDLYELKGNVVLASQARGMLGELPSQAGESSLGRPLDPEAPSG
jgi:class 3 adenylate cyclase/tetratricopeptide (TPR) repeat protein